MLVVCVPVPGIEVDDPRKTLTLHTTAVSLGT